MDAGGPEPLQPGQPVAPALERGGVPPQGPFASGLGRRARLGSCGASVVVLACLVFACISKRWHCFEVYVAPAEIYQMYEALTNILPETRVNSAMLSPELAKDQEPKLAFELQAGLWSTSAVNLCQPKEKVFAEFVDEKQCQAKLRSFCDNILDEKRKDPVVRHFFKTCQKAVHKGSVSFSLVLEPFSPHKNSANLQDGSFEGLRGSLEWQDEDSDPDLCETLVNCQLLAELRPWNFVLIALMFLALLVTVAATSSFAWSVVKLEESKFVARGCHLLFAVAWILVALIALDIYIGEKFAVEDIFQTEDLFYYMLPDATPKPMSSSSLVEEIEVQWPKRLQKRFALPSLVPDEFASSPGSLVASSALEKFSRALRQIPAVKWQNALMVLCGNLMAALVSGQMSTFLDPLKDAAKRAWSKSDRVLNTWLLYLQKSLVDSPNHGNELVVQLLEDLDTMKPVDEICAKENCGGGQQQVKSMGKKFFGHFPAVFKDKLAEARSLIQKCRVLLKKFKRFWSSVYEPIAKILKLVVEAVKSASSDGVLGLLNTVVNVLGKPELVDDLHLLFRRLFTDFPTIVIDVRQLADGLMALIQGFTAALEQVQGAAKQMKTELLQGVSSGSDAASSLRVKTGQVLDEKMAQATSIWQVTTEKQESLLQSRPPGTFEGNGTSSLETLSSEAGQNSYPLLSILGNFATGGSLCSPAARIGSIFLSEIEYMHSSKRGFETSRGGIFKHFGYITFGLMILTVGIFAGHLLFLLGYLSG